ncbi:MAG: hypothetical protein KFW07_03085, partial [Mycoplasmataceae bacterium]|nr:hypothetical protein [Mycoplasmataceae bacterium]
MGKKFLYVGILPFVVSPLLALISCNSSNTEEPSSPLELETRKFKDKESLIKNKTASEAKVAIDNDSSQLDNYYSKIELSKG